jgi:thiol-disulfide isomerase/thioredoxin
MLNIFLILVIIYLVYLNRENFGDAICFGNCGCETEKMCSFHSDRSLTPQVCAAPETNPPDCTQGKFLESIMLKCRHKDEGCAHYTEPKLEDSYGFQISKCGECQARDFISSPEPKESYPQLPPIAPEVLPVGYFMPTALTYERVEPPRNFASAPPLDALRYSGGESFAANNMKETAKKYLPEWLTKRIYGENLTQLSFKGTEAMSSALENGKPTIVLYKTEWCGFCKSMKPVFEKVKTDSANTGIIFKIVDCDEVKVPFVNSYPTIIYTDTAGKSFKYSGRADYQQLLKFVLSPTR